MKKEIVGLFCVCALLGGTTAAVAGAYGEKDQAEELPATPPAVESTAEAAAEVETFSAPGAYMEIGGVYVVENFGEETNTIGSDYGNSGGYQLRAGYRIRPWVAVEGEWEHDIDFGDNLEGSLYALTANGKFYYPFDCRFQPYALIGMGWVNGMNDDSEREDESALGFRFGIGIDTYITKNIGIAAEAGYVLPVTGYLADHDFDTIPISLSAFYRFN